MFSKKQAVLLDSEETRVVAFSAYNDIQRRIIEETKAYHEKLPLKEGIQKEELRTTLGRFVAPKLFQMAINDLGKSGLIVIDRENIRLAGHSADLKGELEELRKEIAGAYLESGLTPPSIKEILQKFANRKSQADSVLSVMLKEGGIVKVSGDLCFHRDILQKLKDDYKNLLLREGKVAPADFKKLTGLSRKFVIPLMEYFDMTKLTIRAGEYRILRVTAKVDRL